jgi:hypothetical protein
MKKLRIALTALFAVFILVPAAPALAATDVLKGNCSQGSCGACSASGASGSSACENNGSDPIAGSNGILSKVTYIISYLAGAAAVILIIISGFMFATANGDASKVANARTSLIYAVVGMVIVIMSQSIIVFVINKL